ncbi:MAG: CoA-binding protein [Chloroflexi bacterium]|nr:CoA-binding protein [Chloroflexota bacterium]MDA1004517.1 CoA-binding protein [Chloroflexota bacterium]
MTPLRTRAATAIRRPRKTPSSIHPLDPIFHPRAVAIVGVPSGSRGMSNGFLSSLIEQRFHENHPLYPVNPKMDEVAGLKCYPSLLDTPDPVDHVISLVPARVAPSLVDQCVTKGVRSIHFFTAGLAETGIPELVALEHEMIGKLRAAGIRAIGPNCMGLYVPESRLAFMGGFPSEPGNVMLISQSGANAGDIVHGLSRRGIRFSKGVSFGNGADVKAWELFDYAASDPDTEVVVAYIEGVQEGRKFFEAVKRCARVKPTIILKGGLTDAGARAAQSHTGSLAGSLAIFDAMCRQAGAMRAETMDDLQDLAVAVTTGARSVRGPRVVLVGGGGGFAVLSADALAREGLQVPPMPESAKAQLREFIPLAGTSVNNPIDTSGGSPEVVERTLRIVSAPDVIDAVFTNPVFGRSPWPDGDAQPQPTAEERAQSRVESAREAAAMLARLQKTSGKAVIVLQRDRGFGGMGGLGVDANEAFGLAAYEAGIAVFPSIQRAARSVGELLRWRAARTGLPAVI